MKRFRQPHEDLGKAFQAPRTVRKIALARNKVKKCEDFNKGQHPKEDCSRSDR